MVLKFLGKMLIVINYNKMFFLKKINNELMMGINFIWKIHNLKLNSSKV